MAARTKGLIVALVVALLVAGLTRPALQAQVRPTPQGSAPHRIVSLVPSVTEVLFAIGAGADVVAVSSYDTYPPQVKSLPKVGALLDPDTERILSLRPDLVIVYGSQSSLETQLARAGIRVFVYRHGGVAEVIDTIRSVGRATGRTANSERVANELLARIDAVRTRVRGRPRPKTLLVFGRQPGTIREIYASGGVGFLHDMLDAAGGDDLFADMKRESVQPSSETLLTRAPDAIVEVRADAPAGENGVRNERQVWSILPSMPAVRNGRIYFLSGDYLVVPGPRLAQGVEAMARVLHPESFK